MDLIGCFEIVVLLMMQHASLKALIVQHLQFIANATKYLHQQVFIIDYIQYFYRPPHIEP